jgi:hypothetical protein
MMRYLGFYKPLGSATVGKFQVDIKLRLNVLSPSISHANHLLSRHPPQTMAGVLHASVYQSLPTLPLGSVLAYTSLGQFQPAL